MKPVRAGPAGPLIVGEAINRGGRFLLLLLLAREVGAEAFGGWVIAVATATILANAADAGLVTAATTAIAADRSQARRYLANAWVAAPVLFLAAFGLVAVLSPALAGGTSVSLLLLLAMGGALENTALLLLAPLRAQERFGPEGAMRAVQGLVLLLGGGAVVIATDGSESAALLFPAVGAGSALLAAAVAVGTFGFTRPRIDTALLRRLLPTALPAFGSALVFFLYFRIDTYMLAHLRGEEATGLYGAAYNFAFGASFLPLLFGRSLLARFAATTSATALRRAYAGAMKGTGALALVLSAGLLLATPVFLSLYGEGFAGARTPYLLLLAAQALFLFTHLNDMLIFGRWRGGTAWRLRLGALVVNVGLNLAFIPALGAAGAALAMICSEAALLAIQAIVVGRLLSAEHDHPASDRAVAEPAGERAA